VPVSEEHSLVRAHHAPVHGRMGRACWVAIVTDDDGEHYEETCVMQILTKKHESSFKDAA
jgi:hypothetical protein